MNVDEPQFVPDLSPVFVLLDGQGNQGTPIFFLKAHMALPTWHNFKATPG